MAFLYLLEIANFIVLYLLRRYKTRKKANRARKCPFLCQVFLAFFTGMQPHNKKSPKEIPPGICFACF
jgi:hypothetical protein